MASLLIILQQRKQTKNENGREISPTVAYWSRIYEFDNKAASTRNDYNTLLITAAANGGERVVVNFQKDKCDFWDGNDFYLKDGLKISLWLFLLYFFFS